MVHNLSSLTLSLEELQLLSKGLSFAPTLRYQLKKHTHKFLTALIHLQNLYGKNM